MVIVPTTSKNKLTPLPPPQVVQHDELAQVARGAGGGAHRTPGPQGMSSKTWAPFGSVKQPVQDQGFVIGSDQYRPQYVSSVCTYLLNFVRPCT